MIASNGLNKRALPSAIVGLALLAGCAHQHAEGESSYYRTDARIAAETLANMDLPECILLVGPEYDRFSVKKMVDRSKNQLIYEYTRNPGQNNEFGYLRLTFSPKFKDESTTEITVTSELFFNPKNVVTKYGNYKLNDGAEYSKSHGGLGFPVYITIAERYLNHLFTGVYFDNNRCGVAEDEYRDRVSTYTKVLNDLDHNKLVGSTT